MNTRLERRPTTEEIRQHAERASDGLGYWLLGFGSGCWEEFTTYVDDDGEVILDEEDDGGLRWDAVVDAIVDAIALDDDGQPCTLKD